MAQRKLFTEKYGITWYTKTHPLKVEMEMIQRGGRWITKSTKKEVGLGKFEHYRNMMSILWPEDSHNRWSDLILRSILDNTICTVMGPKSSGKTHTCAKYSLCDYFCFPNDTTTLMSSTDVRGLELRVWGDVKSLFKRALERFDFLPGHVLDSKHAIATDDINDQDVTARDLRNGIICIPCLSSQGTYVGLSKYVGTKNRRVRLIADEVSFMHIAFLDAVSNLDSNPDFKGVFLGNPIDPYDPLGKAAEPKNGWSSQPEPLKTTTWRSRFMDGITVNLIGTDSPNFDYPQDQPPKFPYLIHKAKIDSVVSFYGAQSHQYYSQCKGVMKTGLISRRVITKELCDQFNATKDVLWEGTERTKVYGLDAAYGNIGGDRCVGIIVEFGKQVGGGVVISIRQPTVIPVTVRSDVLPEDQIARFVKDQCEIEGIQPGNVYFDATGKGSLGTSFARLWSAQVNPVEFGGSPTPRPVCQDLFIHDPKLKVRRLKLATEHYSKFVTELWFSLRYAIEAGQVRNLPAEIIEEASMREWKVVRGDKIEIETKDDMKERMGRSPDLVDALVVAIEGSRRRGFTISKLSNASNEGDVEWLVDLREKNRNLESKFAMRYEAA